MEHRSPKPPGSGGTLNTVVLGGIGGLIGAITLGAGGLVLGVGVGALLARLHVQTARTTALYKSLSAMAARIARLEESAPEVAYAATLQQPGDAASTAAEKTTAEPSTEAPKPGFHEGLGLSDAPPLPPTPEAPEPTPPSPVERGVAMVRGWLFGGNTVVRGGIVVLLVGVTLLARWAAEHSLLPIEARLAGAALIGLALVGVGFKLRNDRPEFGTTLQGGGLAALYLVSFMAFRLYELIPVGLAFGLFVVIAAASGTLAVLQRALPLIVIASLGGFLAPVLASTGSGNHVVLFSYYLVLNISIAAIAFIRSWRVLNVLAFVCTYGVATTWGVLSYQPDQLASTLPFVFAFLLLFTGESLLFAWRQPPKLKGIIDGTLVFGTPLVSLLALAALLENVEMGLAFCTSGLALLYSGIALWLWRTAPDTLRELSEAFIALAIVLGTMAVPFAFEDSPTTAIIWALEGAGLHWVGVRQSRRLARISGLMLQPLAAIAFLIWSFGPHSPGLPLANGQFFSTLALAFAGLVIAREADRNPDSRGKVLWVIAQAAGIWGLGWWILGSFAEIVEIASAPYRVAAAVALLGLTAAALQGTARKLAWESGQLMSLLAIPATGVALWVAFDNQNSLLADGGFIAWPVCLSALYWVIHQLEDAPESRTSQAYAPWLWLCGSFAALALYGLADRTLTLGADWGVAGIGLGLGAVAAASLYAIQQGRGAFGRFSQIHFYYGVGPILFVGMLWVFMTNAHATGATDPLLYLPLLNPVDLIVGLMALTSGFWALRLPAMVPSQPREKNQKAMLLTAGAMSFCWLNAVLARSVSQWTGVEYNPGSLWDSISLQVCFSIAWTLVGLAGMWFSARRHLRKAWMVFAGLLAVTVVKLFIVDLSQLTTPAKIGTFLVVGVLLLIVGYLSPVPPEASSGDDPDSDELPPTTPVPSNEGISALVIWLAGCLALAAVGAGPTSADEGEHDPIKKSDFAWSRTIHPDSSNVIQVIELPFEIYRDSAEPGLADVRVFDADGTAVPHAIARAIIQKTHESTLTSLPLFTIPEGKTASEILFHGGGYRIDLGIDGKRATLKVESTPDIPSPAREKPRAYLVDASRLEGEIVGLEFDLAPQDEDYLVPLRIEATEDLVHYKTLIAAAAVARLASVADPIEQRRVEFRRSEAKYLKISWPTNKSAPMIVGVKAVQRAPQPAVNRVSTRIEGEPLEAPGSYFFDLQGWLPVDRIQVDLGDERALVSAEVFRASAKDGPWRRIYRGLIYRVGSSADPGSRNAAIVVSARPTRYLRVDMDAKGGGADRQAPKLELSWPPEQLYFLNQGEAPHALVYGKIGAPAARFDGAELLAITRKVADRDKPVLPTATLGSRLSLRGQAALEPDTSYPIRTLALWAVLLGSVAIVGGLALRLAREMRA